MAFDDRLAERLRDAFIGLPDITEKKMMGGLFYLMSGNMIGGTFNSKTGLPQFLFRVGKQNEAEALSRPGASIMMNGKQRMGGFIVVEEELCDDEALTTWIGLSLSFVGSLPPK